MPSPAERVCCKEKKYIVKMPGDLCVTEHEDFKKIINKVEKKWNNFEFTDTF